MTTQQQKIFSELGEREWNGIDIKGSWSKHPDASLTAWQFTFKLEDDILYICLSNRMCGEHYSAYDSKGDKIVNKDAKFDDLSISLETFIKKMIQDKDGIKIDEIIDTPEKDLYEIIYNDRKDTKTVTYWEMGKIMEENLDKNA